MDFAFILLGLSIMWLFMFKIEWLFDNGISFWVILIYCILLFSLSFILLNEEYANPNMVKALKMPLISFVVFRCLYFAFRRKYKRNPENTFWVFHEKPIQDIVFTLLFWFLGVGLPFFIV
jgi:hypothetical protein